jgi:hypothetical protein
MGDGDVENHDHGTAGAIPKAWRQGLARESARCAGAARTWKRGNDVVPLAEQFDALDRLRFGRWRGEIVRPG